MATVETADRAAERRAAERALIRTMITTVADVYRLGPRMVQVTCRGGDLDGFTPLGPDQFVYVLAPPEGRTELTIGRDFSWETVADMPEDERPAGAYYTVRRWRPEVAEVDLVVVLHGDEGPGSRWAGRVRPGDPVALWGPRRVFDPPRGTGRYLLVADETGLPAVAAILEWLPERTPADVLVEVGDPTDRLPLRDGTGITLRWLVRGDRPAGTTRLLEEAVCSLDLDPLGLYAWGGAESRAVTAVRRHLRSHAGLTRDQVAMTGYWRHPSSPD